MKSIEIEFFNQGLDIIFNSKDIISFSDYSQLRHQKNSSHFKKVIKYNFNYPLTHIVEIKDRCSDPMIFSYNFKLFWGWVNGFNK